LPLQAALCLCLLATGAWADTILIDGGDPFATAGWDSGLPSATNPGFVTNGVTGTFAAGDNTSSGFNITIAGGNLLKADSARIWFNNLDTFSMTSGSFTGLVSSTRYCYFNGGTIDISGGSLYWHGDVSLAAAAMEISGGTFHVNSQTDHISANTSLDLSGGTFKPGFLNLAGTGSHVTFKSGSDAVMEVGNAISFAGTGTYINFEDATVTGALEITNPGFDPSSYESWYNSGSLLFNGSNTAAFDQVFSVSDNTLTAIPEPGTVGMVALSFATILATRRFFSRR
jgi:hypothetical protein